MPSSSYASVAFAVFALGCSGRLLDIGGATDGGPDSPTGSSSSGGSSSSSGGSSSSSGGSSSSSGGSGSSSGGSPAALAQAACANAVHGPVDPFHDAASLTSRLIGRWYSCSPDASSTSRTSVFRREGIEFKADGTWSVVSIDGSGTPNDLVGVDNQGTWAFVSGTQVNMVFASGGFLPTMMAFERDPRRLNVTPYEAAPIWLVPL
jgi:hypothetical protein